MAVRLEPAWRSGVHPERTPAKSADGAGAAVYRRRRIPSIQDGNDGGEGRVSADARHLKITAL